MNVALVIETYVKAQRGIELRQDVAKLVGALPQTWGQYVRGHTTPTVATVDEWLKRLTSEGLAVPPSVAEAVAAALGADK